MNVKQRRAMSVGALVFVTLLGVGLWPMSASKSYTTDSSSFSVGADGRIQQDLPRKWSASASCSILFGGTKASTENMPMGTFVGEDVCGASSGARLPLILAIIISAVGTVMAVLWFAEVPAEGRDSDPVDPSVARVSAPPDA